MKITISITDVKLIKNNISIDVLPPDLCYHSITRQKSNAGVR